MSRLDCICNRNTKIIATYVMSKMGSYQDLFDGLPYPTDEYTSSRDFFLNEDEWTTFENFERVFRRAKRLVNEQNFYYNCGASSTRLNAWGRFYYFVRLFATPGDGFKRLPFFNNNSNDTKEIEIILPPTYDIRLKKIRSVIKVEFHDDFNPNWDYIGDPYLRGIISSIPTVWGLPPASVAQPMNSYNPETLFNQEPDFIPYNFDVKVEGDVMTLKNPVDGERCVVGEKVLLESEVVRGKKVFLGKYSKLPKDYSPSSWEKREAIVITQSIQVDDQILLTAGEIFKAPYFILEITYDRISFFRRLSQLFRFRKIPKGSGREMFETVDQLRRSIRAKNNAYLALEQTNTDLRAAKSMLDEYARELEHKVEERTTELQKAQQELLQLNQSLEAKVESQVVKLEKYNELRRYLSSKLTDEILGDGHTLGSEPKRKMMTVVFTDIRDFSKLTDSLEPEELFHLLDSYLSEMIKIVHSYDGTLNKIVGDGLLIFFGDPIEMADHCERAVRMAIDMQKRVSDLKDDWLAYGYELGIGIGINTAYMTVGNIGSDMHRDYTVIGNQVNVASRLESKAKAGQILISQRSYSKVKGIVEVEEMGPIKVKGIHDPVRTYNVLWDK
jgi:class 3 adenylate cyclase